MKTINYIEFLKRHYIYYGNIKLNKYSSFTEDSIIVELSNAMMDLSSIRLDKLATDKKVDEIMEKYKHRGRCDTYDYFLIRKNLSDICVRCKSYYYAYNRLLELGNENDIWKLQPEYTITHKQIEKIINEEIEMEKFLRKYNYDRITKKIKSYNSVSKINYLFRILNHYKNKSNRIQYLESVNYISVRYDIWMIEKLYDSILMDSIQF